MEEKVIKMQISALQQGCLDACQNTVKIKQADEIRTKFLSQITHELRTPLNSILGFSELLENEFAGKLNAKQKEYVNDIKISGINLLGMINEILDMSKIEAKAAKLNMQTFSVTTAINEVVNTIMPLIIKKNIKFTKFTEDIEINADYIKFQGIVLNLLGNAIKFTQENGEISIRAYKSGKNPHHIPGMRPLFLSHSTRQDKKRGKRDLQSSRPLYTQRRKRRRTEKRIARRESDG